VIDENIPEENHVLLCIYILSISDKLSFPLCFQ